MSEYRYFERIAARSRMRAARWLAVVGIAYTVGLSSAYIAKFGGHPSAASVAPSAAGVTMFAMCEYRRSRNRADWADKVHADMVMAEFLRLPDRGADISGELHAIELMTRDRTTAPEPGREIGPGGTAGGAG